MLTLKQRNTFLEIKGTTQPGTPGTLKNNKSSESGVFLISKCEILCTFYPRLCMCLDQQRISGNTMQQRVASCLDGVPNGTPLWALFSPHSALCVTRYKKRLRKKSSGLSTISLSATKQAICFLDVLVLHLFHFEMCRMEPPSNFRGGVLKPGLKHHTTLYLEPQISFHGVPLPTCRIAVKQLFTPIHERGFRQKREI